MVVVMVTKKTRWERCLVDFFRPDVECSCCRRASGSTTASVATVGLLQAQQLLLPPLDCFRLNNFCCHRWTASGSTTSVATVGLLALLMAYIRSRRDDGVRM